VKLSEANVGCYVDDFLVGALAYADDIVLLAPTSSAMRQLLIYVMFVDVVCFCLSVHLSACEFVRLCAFLWAELREIKNTYIHSPVLKVVYF